MVKTRLLLLNGRTHGWLSVQGTQFRKNYQSLWFRGTLIYSNIVIQRYPDLQILCIRGTLILNYCDSEVLWSPKIVSCQQNRKLKSICSLCQSWWRLPLWGEYQFMATSPWLQNMKNLTSAKVCEDTSGPEECIEPPDAVTFGFKNRSPTIKSSQLN